MNAHAGWQPVPREIMSATSAAAWWALINTHVFRSSVRDVHVGTSRDGSLASRGSKRKKKGRRRGKGVARDEGGGGGGEKPKDSASLR